MKKRQKTDKTEKLTMTQGEEEKKKKWGKTDEGRQK